MKQQSTEGGTESRPVWEGLEAFARQAVQRLLQQILKESNGTITVQHPRVRGLEAWPCAVCPALCPFPTVPRYSGTGDTNGAASFVCIDDHATDNPMAAPEYLQ